MNCWTGCVVVSRSGVALFLRRGELAANKSHLIIYDPPVQFWCPNYYSASDTWTPDCLTLIFLRVFILWFIEMMHGYGGLNVLWSMLSHPFSFEVPYLLADNDCTWCLLYKPCIALPSYIENPCSPYGTLSCLRGMLSHSMISVHAQPAYPHSLHWSFIDFGSLRCSDLSVSSLTVIRNLTPNCGQAQYGPKIRRGPWAWYYIMDIPGFSTPWIFFFGSGA